MKKIISTVCVILLALGLATNSVQARGKDGGNWVYKVEITNITKGTNLTQGLVFTPILLATHASGVHLLNLGEPASEALAKLAEGGDTGPLAGVLGNMDGVHYVTTTGGPLLPGHSVEVEIPYNRKFTALSMASMLLPTNDGFIWLDGSSLPFWRNQEVTRFSPGYDAGSELNDELCASIPGPHCAGEGYSPEGGEGKVHVHSGLHGVGDLDPEDYDWRNPVARITVELQRQ